MIRTIIRVTFLVGLFATASIQAETALPGSAVANEHSTLSNPGNAPTRTINFYFNPISSTGSKFTLTNFKTGRTIDFPVRKDETVVQAQLHLQFTASPALTPLLSQLKIYLNEELVNVMALTEAQIGKSTTVDLPIDPRYVNDSNRLKLEFIGHYKAICEDPVHSSIWMDIEKPSRLELTVQTLLIKNDLSHFPQPFFDTLDKEQIQLPIIFANQPNIMQKRAAAILASWFGSKALWRQTLFSALFNELPQRNAIVFATNTQRPDFLKDYKTVKAPTIEMINHPHNPYIKLLLILGRDEQDLLTAVQGIAQGNILFRGTSVFIEEVKLLEPRKPYDAPNWIPTDKPVRFADLEEYKEQLQTQGYSPVPITLNFNVPPDLFLYKSRGMDLDLKYRYSVPPKSGTSQLDISVNNSFVKSYPLEEQQEEKAIVYSKSLHAPIQLGVNNQFKFEFDYGLRTPGGSLNGQCINYKIPDNLAVIDSSSTFNLSHYYHYISMPDLNAFVSSGFPFSILADLSQTVVYIAPQAPGEALTTLLNVAGNIGAATGYPALAMTLIQDWSEVKTKDADLLIIGTLPQELATNDALNLLLSTSHDWVKKPLNSRYQPEPDKAGVSNPVISLTRLNASSPVAALIGLESPYFKKRSIVGLLAENPQDFGLLNKALTNNANHDSIFGSVSVIRDSGINSLKVGTVYHLGYLPWWARFWSALQDYPINLALMSLLAAVIATFLIWNGLSVISKRRLKGSEKDSDDR